MYKSQVSVINESLLKTRKAIIALGCSFVQGQGAFNDELYEQFEWKYIGEGRSLYPEIKNSKDIKRILKSYPSIKKYSNSELDLTFMEYDNAFVNVLANKYFDGEYTPINLGIRGCGNRATIKELYFYPEIDLHLAKEIIVVYCPSGLERFDFINDSSHDHFRFMCMWPHYQSQTDPARKALWEGYNKVIWSEKFGVLEQLAHVQELLNWCRLHRAKLIITPAFDLRYDKQFFVNELAHTASRDINKPLEYKKGFLSHPDYKLADLWPWHKMFEPNGYKTFAQLALSNESVENKDDFYFQFLNNRSPNGWITPCAHPGQKAHDLFASCLHKHILENIK